LLFFRLRLRDGNRENADDPPGSGLAGITVEALPD